MLSAAVLSVKPGCLPLRPAAAQPARPRRVFMARAAHTERMDLSDEWSACDSLCSSDDLLEYMACANHAHQPRNTRLAEVMQVNLVLTSPEATLEEVAKLLAGPPSIEGLPVVDSAKQLVGVVSRKDLKKGGACVKDVMSTPPIALQAASKVSDAAVVMTQRKFHRVPVVAEDGSTIVGIVTRTDIFWALTQTDQEAEDGASYFAEHGLDM
ncbi:hypothetical protein ABPG75_001728 [Micractinium tetrahymenae]